MRPTLLRASLAWLLLFVCCIKLNAQLVADFSLDKTGGCAPLTVRFQNLSTGAGPGATYAWDLGNGNSSALRDPAAIYNNEQVYTVTLTVRDGAQTATRSKTVTVYRTPVPDFSVQRPVLCMPEAAQFTVSGTAGDGVINSYQWNFGDGSVQQGFGASMTHFYSSPIEPTVSLTTTNSFGCAGTVTKTNFLEILPAINVSFSVNKTLLCNTADSFVLTNASTGPGTLSYLWDFGDGSTSTQAAPVKKYSTRGLYNIRLTVSNEHGCSVTGFSQQVNVGYFNTNFTSQVYCREAQFFPTSYLSPSSSSWDFGNGQTATGTFNIRQLYATAGTYDVRLINTYGVCRDTVIKPVTVVENQSFNTAITLPATACAGSNVVMTATSTLQPTATSWDFGDGSTFQNFGNSANKIYALPGTYTVTLRNTFGSCTETVTRSIVVNPVPGTTSFLIDSFGVCGAPVNVRFTDTTTGATAWNWQQDFFGNTFSTQQTTVRPFNNNGYYWITLTVSNAFGCSARASRSLSIFAPSVSIVTRSTSSPRGWYDCDSLRLRLGVNANVTIATYNWELGNGVTSGAAEPEVFYDQPGSYLIRLNYVTDRGCQGTATFLARVYPKPRAGFVNTAPCGNSLALTFTDTSFFSDQWQWTFGNNLGYGYSSTTGFTFPDNGQYTVQLITHIGRCSDTVRRVVPVTILPSSIQITQVQNTCAGTRGLVQFDQRSLRANGGTWDFGDGTTIPYDSSQHAVTHTYTSSGTYTVRINTSYNGCPLTAQAPLVRVLLKQTPQLVLSPPVICSGGSMSFQVNNLVANPFAFSTTLWGQYNVNSFILPSGQSAGAQFSMSGIFNPSVFNGTVSDFPPGVYNIRAVLNPWGTGCSDTTTAVSIQINGPQAGFRVLNNESCFKTAFVFQDTSRVATSSTIQSWRWDMGDGQQYTNATNAQVRHTYNTPGFYTVRLTVTDATGCSSTALQPVQVRGVKAAFNPNGMFLPNVPLNSAISFFNNSISNTTGNPLFTWHYGNGITSNNYSGQYTYTVADNYTVMLVASDGAGCLDTARYNIRVADFNTAFSFTTSFLGTGNCLPALVRINNLSVGFIRLNWDFGDGSTSSQTYPSHVYTQPGTYRITLNTFGFNGLTGTYVDSVTITQPSVQLTADRLQGCVSQTVNLAATTQHAVQYQWDFGNGDVRPGPLTETYAYPSPGVFRPQMIVRDANNCPASGILPQPIVIDSLSVAIGGIPPVVCDSVPVSFLADVYSFASTALGTPLRYSWSFGTGIAADTAALQNPVFRFPRPGVYTVRLRVFSQYGCEKEAVAQVFVRQWPRVNLSGPAEACVQAPVLFAASSQPADSLQWSWSFGNGNNATVANPPAQVYTTTGTFPVLLIGNRNGCIDTVAHSITIHGRPMINAAPRQAVLCRGDSVLLQANGGVQYTWSPAAGLSNPASSSPNASPAQSTLYRVTVLSDKGCSSTDSVFIRVAQPITVQLPASAEMCAGGSVQLSASGATSYQWIGATAGLSNAAIPNPVAAPAATATYTVVGRDADNCFTDTARVQVLVRPLPTVNAGPDLQAQGGVPLQLTATGSPDVTGWRWEPANRLSCANCPNPVFNPNAPTTFIVQARNQYNCVRSDTLRVNMPCGQEWVFVPNTFSPNRDGKNDVFYIKGSGVSNIRYMRIFDRNGQLIFERNNIAIDDRSAGWDGRFKNEVVGTGTYVYVALLACEEGNTFLMKGTVTVVR
ncbi:PKD domain-containing protein [Flaviaesturariibacter amylovorans]|uniref:PKD domain-containing protein n=1 Tax=Flaviaesturariibacter amylovorans TaxID=1084520 RepID=A0ABP8GEW0_9BACT